MSLVLLLQFHIFLDISRQIFQYLDSVISEVNLGHCASFEGDQKTGEMKPE